MIRPARFVDIPRIADLLLDGYALSKYALRCGVDVAETKKILTSGLQRVGSKTSGACLVNLAVNGEQIVGLHFGILERVYHIGTMLMATDLWFYVSSAASPRDFVQLFDLFEAWALENPKVIEIKPGVTDVLGDPERLAKFYERRGYKRSGLMFERSIDR